MSTGYSVEMSSSLSNFGNPSSAAEKLSKSVSIDRLDVSMASTHQSTAYSVQNTFFLVSIVRVSKVKRSWL